MIFGTVKNIPTVPGFEISGFEISELFRSVLQKKIWIIMFSNSFVQLNVSNLFWNYEI